MGAARDPEQPPGPPEDEGPHEGDGQLVSTSPWNIMIKHRQVQRRGRRSQMTTSFTDPMVSMDLLRAVLQPSINEEIQNVFNKYMKFFQKAASNVRENVGEEVDSEQLIQETCRNCLEQRARQVEEESSQRGSPIPKKRKGRPPGQSLLNDRGASGMATWKLKSSELLRRDGPKWDPSRLTETTTFVLGSRANKALGMGGTRGRLYIKHPHLFKYAADPEDKHWLAEHQHMRATGGKMVSSASPAAATCGLWGGRQAESKGSCCGSGWAVAPLKQHLTGQQLCPDPWDWPGAATAPACESASEVGPRNVESLPTAGLAVHKAWSPGSSRSSRGGQSSRMRVEPLLPPLSSTCPTGLSPAGGGYSGPGCQRRLQVRHELRLVVTGKLLPFLFIYSFRPGGVAEALPGPGVPGASPGTQRLLPPALSLDLRGPVAGARLLAGRERRGLVSAPGPKGSCQASP
uniref:Deoxynucleotidyltransferase terminal-interacting protein 1 n=1 Tax=Crocodylus porosus TaxID=8502 RepID=A0A7M4ENN5_CROPO